MAVQFKFGYVGSSARVFVGIGFALKDVLKNTGVARWEAARKQWSIPHTALAVRIAEQAIRTAAPSTQIVFDPEVEELRKYRTSAADVAVLPEDAFAACRFKPWATQRVGVSMISQMQGCLLAWDMGSGKTKTVVDAIVVNDFRTVLVLCPTSVVSVWQRQVDIHMTETERAKTRVVCLDNSMPVARRAALMTSMLERSRNNNQRVIVVVNYEAAWRGELAEAIGANEWDLCVADESHRISNPGATVTKFCATTLLRCCRRRVALSGTPMGNGPIDIFGQFQFVEPALFGQGVTRFRTEYCVMGGFEGRQIVNYKNMDEFERRLRLFSSKVTLDDVVELPEHTDEQVEVKLGAEAMRVYRELKDEFISQYGEGVVVATNAITKMLRLQQATSGFAVVQGSDDESQVMAIDTAKADATAELIGDISRNEPVVVFCRFRHDLDAIHRVALALKRPSYEISGRGNQQVQWERSCDLGEGPIIAVQIQAGGVGIDLTRAKYCIYYSIGFSLTDYSQSRARVKRPGQKRNVVYYHMVAPGTVDSVVYRALSLKQDLVDAVLDELVSAKVVASGQAAQ